MIPAIISERGKVRLTEDYQSLRAGSASPLDGTWKLTSYYTIHNKDTLHSKLVKYKTYYQGNFCTGSYNSQRRGKKNTTCEYGIFRMNGKNKLKENVSYSGVSLRNNHSYEYGITMKGNDTITINATFPTGIEEVEKYSRMK